MSQNAANTTIMDKYSVETLIKETLIYYCRNYVGEAVEFKLDGLICITVNSDPVDTVFKIHEIISGNGTNISNYDSSRRKCKRKLSNRYETHLEGDENSTDFNKENHTDLYPDETLDKKIKVELDENYSNEEGNSEINKFSCGVCSNFRDVSKQYVFNHLLDNHSGENEHICFCMTNNCQIGFLNEDQYLKHFQDFHKSLVTDSVLKAEDLRRSLQTDEGTSGGINAVPIFPISSKGLSKHQTSISNVPKSSRPFSLASTLDGATVEAENYTSPLSDVNDDYSQPKDSQMCDTKLLDITSCDRPPSEQGVYSCPYCDLVFKRKNSCDSHILTHSSDGKLLECNKCSLVFSRVDSLKRHAAKCQGQNDSSVIMEYSGSDLPDDNLMDTALSTLFSNSEDLSQGIACARGLDWASGFDQEGFNSKDDAIEIASDQEENILGEPNLSLEMVPSFKRSSRRRHTKYITTLDPSRCFTCEVCLEFIAGGVEAFRIHCSQLHQRVPCPYCGCTYTQKASMERHQRQHTGERPYICALCPRSYTRKENLHMHRLRFHSVAEDLISVP